MNNKERIQKIISNYGNYSRRQVEKLILEKKIKINGEIANLGDRVNVNDKIEIDDKQIKFNLKHDYYLVNKPKGYICERKDKLGKEVISLINNYSNRNLLTIGRLDVNTTGLIIVTTDGELSNIVNSPKNKIKKVYLAWINKSLSKDQMLLLQKGVKLDDGYVTKPIIKWKTIFNSEDKVLIKLTIIEGKKNQIKRMFKSIDREVINLKRIQIGFHKLDGINIGQYRKLNKEKIYEGLGLEYEK